MNDLKINLLKKKYNRNLIFLCIIIFSSLSLRIFFIPNDVPIKLDGIDYFDFAFELSKHGKFPTGILGTNDGWSIFLSPFFTLVGLEDFMNLIYTQRIVSIVLSSLTIIPVYFLCRQFTIPTFSLIGTSIFAFHPSVIENSILGITESLFILLITLAILFTILKNEKFIFLAFIFSSFASVVRYEGLLFFIPLTIIFFIKFRKKKKIYFKYPILLGIIFLILFPIANLRSEDGGDDGLFSHLIQPEIYMKLIFSYQNSPIEQNESNNTVSIQENNFLLNSFYNTLKYLIWVAIPFFLILVPIGFYQIYKSRQLDYFYLFIFGIFLILPAMYAYGREIQEIRYLFVLFPIFAIFSANAFNFDKKYLKSNWILLIVVIIFLFSFFYLYLDQKDNVFENEIYDVTKHIVDVSNGINIYKGIDYVKVATLENNWPNSLPLKENGRTTYFVNKIPLDNSKTLEEFLLNSRNSNLTHLVIMENNLQPFLNDVYKNYQKFPYLTKTFDSSDFDFKNRILVFKINYQLFDNLV